MIENLKINKALWMATTIVVAVAALGGVINPNIYNRIFAEQFLPGALPQDILTLILCLLLFISINKLEESNVKMQIFIIGLLASFFYLYGIFTIERVYNYLYLIYLAAFGLSFWSMFYSLMHLKRSVLEKIALPSDIAKISSGFGIIIAVFFSFLWVASLIPLMVNHDRIEFLYSIYILDLCFVMPAFFITSILTLKKNPIGIAFLPAVYFVGFFVIFPLGLGEIAKPFYGQTSNFGQMAISFVFSAAMLLVGLLHLSKIEFGPNN